MTASLSALAARISGRVVTRSEPDWDSVRVGFNLTSEVHPLAVVLPAEAEDVPEIVDFARTHGLRVAAQATGHNNGAHHDLGDALLVDVQALREVTIDAEARRVRVGAGVRWRDVVPMLSDKGLAALHGSSPSVGIAGYSLGGGMGWLARKYGLQANSVRAFEVVTADARLIRVDPETDPRLFWALRGGNGNFGVVTALEFEVYRVDDLYAGAMFFPANSAQLVLRRWFGLAPALPDEMMTWTSLIHFPDAPEVPEDLRGQQFTVFHGVYLGDERTGASLLRPIRDLGPAMDTFAMVRPAALADLAMDPPEPLPYLSTTALVEGMTPQALDDLLDAAGPQSGSPLALIQVRQLGGALSRQAPGAGARATVPGDYSVFALGVVQEEAERTRVMAYLDRLTVALRPYRIGEYANFVEQPGDASRFWAPETWQRLRSVKTATDPDDLFAGNHAVPVLPRGQVVNG